MDYINSYKLQGNYPKGYVFSSVPIKIYTYIQSIDQRKQNINGYMYAVFSPFSEKTLFFIYLNENLFIPMYKLIIRTIFILGLPSTTILIKKKFQIKNYTTNWLSYSTLDILNINGLKSDRIFWSWSRSKVGIRLLIN